MDLFQFLTAMQAVDALQAQIIRMRHGLVEAGFTKAQANKIVTHIFTGGDVKKEDLIP